MTVHPHGPIAKDDFPAWELRQQAKHEYAGGHVYSLAGGTFEHNQLASDLLVAIANHLRSSRYSVFGSDALIEMRGSIRYADVVATNDERDRVRGLTALHHPSLIVEVLSESTAPIDLGVKRREYQRIATLEECVMIDSRKRWATVHRRTAGSWTSVAVIPDAGEQMLLELRSIDLRIDLDNLYGRIQL